MKQSIVILFLVISFSFNLVSQSYTEPYLQDSVSAKIYPYVLPIWGQKLYDRDINFQLPFGVNVNYVGNIMDIDITQFDLSINPNDPIIPGVNDLVNNWLDNNLTLDVLNFQTTSAQTNGVNLRVDSWIFPFINLYGIYSRSKGSTSVSLQPRIPYGDEGEVIELNEFGSAVDFSADSYGFGTTLVFGFNNIFLSSDVNMTFSKSELLNDAVQLVVASTRMGYRFEFENEMNLSIYLGAMWRNFVKAKGNRGQISLNEVFPELGSRAEAQIQERINTNNEAIAVEQAIIDDPNSTPVQVALAEQAKGLLEIKNDFLYTLDAEFTQVVSSELDYFIKKEIVNHWSTQFGFNLEFTPNWTLRSEFGIADGNSFFLAGLQYRFGL